MGFNMRQFVSGHLLNTPMEQQGSGASNLAQKGRTFHAPERTFIRGTGCYNCLHYNDGDVAKQHYLNRRQGDIVALRQRGVTEDMVKQIISKQDAIIMPPKSGICVKGMAQADFVNPAYMCHQWSGRIKPDDGIAETPQELRNRVDGDVDKEP